MSLTRLALIAGCAAPTFAAYTLSRAPPRAAGAHGPKRE